MCSGVTGAAPVPCLLQRGARLKALLEPDVALRFTTFGYGPQPLWWRASPSVPQYLCGRHQWEVSATIEGRSWTLRPGGFGCCLRYAAHFAGPLTSRSRCTSSVSNFLRPEPYSARDTSPCSMALPIAGYWSPFQIYHQRWAMMTRRSESRPGRRCCCPPLPVCSIRSHQRRHADLRSTTRPLRDAPPSDEASERGRLIRLRISFTRTISRASSAVRSASPRAAG